MLGDQLDSRIDYEEWLVLENNSMKGKAVLQYHQTLYSEKVMVNCTMCFAALESWGHDMENHMTSKSTRRKVVNIFG